MGKLTKVRIILNAVSLKSQMKSLILLTIVSMTLSALKVRLGDDEWQDNNVVVRTGFVWIYSDHREDSSIYTQKKVQPSCATSGKQRQRQQKQQV